MIMAPETRAKMKEERLGVSSVKGAPGLGGSI
jgi:hypothetical protein